MFFFLFFRFEMLRTKKSSISQRIAISLYVNAWESFISVSVPIFMSKFFIFPINKLPFGIGISILDEGTFYENTFIRRSVLMSSSHYYYHHHHLILLLLTYIYTHTYIYDTVYIYVYDWVRIFDSTPSQSDRNFNIQYWYSFDITLFVRPFMCMVRWINLWQRPYDEYIYNFFPTTRANIPPQYPLQLNYRWISSPYMI